jgi:hypothetical protein
MSNGNGHITLYCRTSITSALAGGISVIWFAPINSLGADSRFAWHSLQIFGFKSTGDSAVIQIALLFLMPSRWFVFVLFGFSGAFPFGPWRAVVMNYQNLLGVFLPLSNFFSNASILACSFAICSAWARIRAIISSGLIWARFTRIIMPLPYQISSHLS